MSPHTQPFAHTCISACGTCICGTGGIGDGRIRRFLFTAWLISGTMVGLLAGAGVGIGAGCSKADESNVRLHRNGEQPAVVTVFGSAQFDLGSAKEIEPNDDPSQATPVVMPVAISGVLGKSGDIDVFSFRPKKNEIVHVRIAPLEDVDLMVEVTAKDSTGSPLIGDRGPRGTAEGIANMAVSKGVTYQVFVKEFVKKNSKKPARQEPSKPYLLEIAPMAPTRESEREPNDDPANAKTLLVGDRPTGYIGWAHDIDYWKLSLEGFRDLDLIDLSIDGINGVSLELKLFAPDGSEVLSRRGEKSSSIYVRGLATSGHKFLMAKISAKRSHEQEPYRFHFATRRSIDGEEVEPNDAAKQATALGVPGDSKGEASGEIVKGDTDFFVLPPSPERRLLKVEISASSSVNAEAIANGEVLAQGKGGRQRLTLIVEAKTRARLKLATSRQGEPEEYTIQWETRAAPLVDDDADIDSDSSDDLE